jgi:ribonuclease HI
VFSAEQYAIIEAIQLEKNNRHEIVIITDSVSTIMTAENRTPTKKPKTQTIRNMLNHEGPRITLLWVMMNEKADQAAKEALDDWLTQEDFKKRD